MTETFTTTLRASDDDIVVPEAVAVSLGRSERIPVAVTIDGVYDYRTAMTSAGGRHIIPFDAATRAATGHAPGDELEVTVAVDDAPRETVTSSALDAALEGDAIASAAWERLSPAKKAAYARSVGTAATDAARRRRIAEVLGELKVGA